MKASNCAVGASQDTPQVMDALDRRKLKYFLRLNYPMQVTYVTEGIVARYVDLPDCECRSDDLDKLKLAIDQCRLEWLTQHIEAGETPPMPNSHSDFRPDRDEPKVR